MSTAFGASSRAAWPCAALSNVPLGARTTLRVGGRAEWLLEPASQAELAAAVVAARERGMAVRILGGGANLLVADGVLPGVVIATDRLDRLFRPSGREEAAPLDEGEGTPVARVAPEAREVDPRLVAWCGTSLPALVSAASRLGWSGLEGLVGVPGKTGGGVAMNAGGRWGELWDVIEEVRLLDPDGTFRDVRREDCSPRYRDGNLGESVVVACVLRLEPDDPARVRARTSGFLREKNAVQPVTEATCGCIFKNPDPEVSGGRSAGRLIDEAGLKGLSVGAARVSERHGNFIVNTGGATAGDVLALVRRVREEVRQRYGIDLELEVRVWAADEEEGLF